jgi:hypothetical protein
MRDYILGPSSRGNTCVHRSKRQRSHRFPLDWLSQSQSRRPWLIPKADGTFTAGAAPHITVEAFRARMVDIPTAHLAAAPFCARSMISTVITSTTSLSASAKRRVPNHSSVPRRARVFVPRSALQGEGAQLAEGQYMVRFRAFRDVYEAVARAKFETGQYKATMTIELADIAQYLSGHQR